MWNERKLIGWAEDSLITDRKDREETVSFVFIEIIADEVGAHHNLMSRGGKILLVERVVFALNEVRPVAFPTQFWSEVQTRVVERIVVVVHLVFHTKAVLSLVPYLLEVNL